MKREETRYQLGRRIPDQAGDVQAIVHSNTGVATLLSPGCSCSGGECTDSEHSVWRAALDPVVSERMRWGS